MRRELAERTASLGCRIVMMDGATGGMMGWMMSFGLLGWVLIIALLVAILIVVLRRPPKD